MHRRLLVPSRAHLWRTMGRTYSWRAVARASSDVGPNPGGCLNRTPAHFRRNHRFARRSRLSEPASLCSQLVLGCGWVLCTWERRQRSYAESAREGNLASKCLVYALLEHVSRPIVNRRICRHRFVPPNHSLNLTFCGVGQLCFISFSPNCPTPQNAG